MKLPSTTIGRRFPPALVAGLVLLWLLLGQDWSFAQLVLGALIAAGLSYASASLRPLQPRLRRVHLGIGLAATVIGDIVRSNIGVARVVVGVTGGRRVHSGFVAIPLELRDPHGLAVLAIIVTSTPGTVWVDYDAASQTLTLHVLDLKNEQEWIDWIKNRYERVLREIFE